MRALNFGLVLAMAGALAGCRGGDTEPKLTLGGANELVFREVRAGQTLGHDEQIKVLLDTWQVTAPVGSITGSGKFWEVMGRPFGTPDEQRLLDANGIRVAIMPVSQWNRAKATIDAAPAVSSQPATLAGPTKGTLQPRDLEHATIFYYDRDFALCGRTFDESQMLWGLFWAPEPSNLTTVRLDVSPVIRSKRRQIKMTRMGETYELEYIQPETIYDLGITAELPLGSVLVLAPSPSAFRSATSMGRALLTQEEGGILSEQIIFVYPRGYRYSEKATDEAKRKAEQEATQQQANPAGKP